MAERDVIEELIALEYSRRQLEDELRQLSAALEKKREQALQVFEQMGLQSIVRDGITVYLRRAVQVRIADGQQKALVDAFRRRQLHDLVTVRISDLAAFVQEASERTGEVPKWLAHRIEIADIMRIVVRSTERAWAARRGKERSKEGSGTPQTLTPGDWP